MERAKGFFLRFSNEERLEETKAGEILRRKPGAAARIYVAGLLVAEEENFAFSYNITSLTEPMRKALNRERTNVGRTAYTDRVKQMLLSSSGSEVGDELASQLQAIQSGLGCDEVNWKEVAIHAVRILNGRGEYLFATADQLIRESSSIDHARSDGIQVITIPDAIQRDVVGLTDLSGVPIRDTTKKNGTIALFSTLSIVAAYQRLKGMYSTLGTLSSIFLEVCQRTSPKYESAAP